MPRVRVGAQVAMLQLGGGGGSNRSSSAGIPLHSTRYSNTASLGELVLQSMWTIPRRRDGIGDLADTIVPDYDLCGPAVVSHLRHSWLGTEYGPQTREQAP